MADENDMLLKEILQRTVIEQENPAPSCSVNDSAPADGIPIQLKLEFNQSMVTYRWVSESLDSKNYGLG